MKKTLLLFVLLVISTTSYAREEYYRWGSFSDGGMKSIVPYPRTRGVKFRRYKINPSSYGKYLGYSVSLKTTNVNHRVYLFIYIMDKDYNSIKYIYGDDDIKGTTNWKRYYSPHIYIPSHAKWISTGIHLQGVGKVEYYDDQLKEYNYK